MTATIASASSDELIEQEGANDSRTTYFTGTVTMGASPRCRWAKTVERWSSTVLQWTPFPARRCRGHVTYLPVALASLLWTYVTPPPDVACCSAP